MFRNVRKIAKSDYYLRYVCPSVRLSAWNNSALTGRVFVKFDIWVFFEKMSGKFKFHYNLTRITDTLHEGLRTYMVLSRWILPRMRDIWAKVVQKIHTHILYSVTFFSENRALYEIMWKNMVQPDRPRMTIQHSACVLYAGYLRLQTHTQNFREL
jgi:hypothetical protein